MKTDLIEKLKAIPIDILAIDLGLDTDKYLRGECPRGHFSESGKCFRLDLNRNRYHCFNCGIDGDTIDLHRLVIGCSFAESQTILSQKYLGMKIEPMRTSRTQKSIKKFNSSIPERLNIQIKQAKEYLVSIDFYFEKMNDFLIHKKKLLKMMLLLRNCQSLIITRG